MDISEFNLYLVSDKVENVELHETLDIVTLDTSFSFSVDKLYQIELFAGDNITLYINQNQVLGIEKEGKLLFFDPKSHIKWSGSVNTESFLVIEEATITEVQTTSNSDFFFITDENESFLLRKEYKYRPCIGDEIISYTHGCAVYGLVINGKLIFFKTEFEYKKQNEEEKIANEKLRCLEYEKNREQREKDYSELPEKFRIFMAHYKASLKPEEIFWREERMLFCCKEAVKIAEALKDPRKVIKFNKLSAKKQYAMVPGMDVEHSGTTFSTSVKLAYHYLKDDLLNPENSSKPLKKKNLLRYFWDFWNFY